jgi:hypothetical protein
VTERNQDAEHHTRKNKALVLEAFDMLFKKHDYAGAEKSCHLTTPNIAHVPPVVRACSISSTALRRPPNSSTERLRQKGISSPWKDDFRTSDSL